MPTLNLSPLTALSPLDGRYADKVAELRPIFSEHALLKFRSIIELKWLQSLATLPQIPELHAASKELAALTKELEDHFGEAEVNRIKSIEQNTKHDIKAIEYFLRDKLAEKNLQRLFHFLHFAATSDDINNLSYALMVKTFRTEHLLPNLDNIINKLREFAHQYSGAAMLGRTHGQIATPTTMGKEMANFVARLERLKKIVLQLSIIGKFNGSVGNFNALTIAYPDIEWLKFIANFVAELGLNYNAYSTQIEPHDGLAEFSNYLALINTVLLDLVRDIWGYMALGFFTQVTTKAEVGSSVMPHKVNPIDLENAEGNLGLANALFNHFTAKLPISRWQRDLSDSTVLRNMGVAFAYSILAYKNIVTGLNKLTLHTEKLNAELNEHWEILAEPIQTVLRANGVIDAYEKLKAITHGKQVTKDTIQKFIKDLDVPKEAKQRLLALTPANYIGKAKELAEKV